MCVPYLTPKQKNIKKEKTEKKESWSQSYDRELQRQR
jgi:hypothetical protein